MEPAVGPEPGRPGDVHPLLPVRRLERLGALGAEELLGGVEEETGEGASVRREVEVVGESPVDELVEDDALGAVAAGEGDRRPPLVGREERLPGTVAGAEPGDPPEAAVGEAGLPPQRPTARSGVGGAGVESGEGLVGRGCLGQVEAPALGVAGRARLIESPPSCYRGGAHAGYLSVLRADLGGHDPRVVAPRAACRRCGRCRTAADQASDDALGRDLVGSQSEWSTSGRLATKPSDAPAGRSERCSRDPVVGELLGQ